MPLIRCPDCGKEFSDAAAACPNCGRPQHPSYPASMRGIGCTSAGCLTLIVVGLIGTFASRSDTPVSDAERESAIAAEHAKNAASAVRSEKSQADALMFAVKEAIRQAMRDPESADFRDVAVIKVGPHLTVCGEVNGKNGFGGFTGFQHFLGDSTGVMIRDDDNAATFRKRWNSRCVAGAQ